MKKLILIITTSVALAAPIIAQQTPTEQGTAPTTAVSNMPSTTKSSNPGLTIFNWLTLRNFTGALTLGWQKASLSDLNGTLAAKGYSAAPENMFTIGGLGQFTISRFVFSLEGTWLWGQGREAQIGANTIKNSFSAFRGIGTLGYIVYQTERLDIFPYLGGGLAGYNLIMTNQQSDSFDNVITTGQRGAMLTSLSLMFTAGAQLVYRLPIMAADKGVFGLAIGVKGGYDVAFAQSDWYLGGINDLVKTSGGPRSPLTGPYAQALIGIWFDFY